jgi:hypothetical protein
MHHLPGAHARALALCALGAQAMPTLDDLSTAPPRLADPLRPLPPLSARPPRLARSQPRRRLRAGIHRHAVGRHGRLLPQQLRPQHLLPRRALDAPRRRPVPLRRLRAGRHRLPVAGAGAAHRQRAARACRRQPDRRAQPPGYSGYLGLQLRFALD